MTGTLGKTNSHFDPTQNGVGDSTTTLRRLLIGADVIHVVQETICLELIRVLSQIRKGLCGFYNLKQTDDFMLPSGSTTINAAEFGDAWKTDHHCNVGGVASGMPVHPCDLERSFRAKATSDCSVLKYGGFVKQRDVMSQTSDLLQKLLA